MDEALSFILSAWLMATTVCTVQFALFDYRDFDRVVKQCEKQGFIQDKTQRISCSLEKK